MCFVEINGINNYWKYYKINYDDDIVGFHDKLKFFLNELKGDSYLMLPGIYIVILSPMNFYTTWKSMITGYSFSMYNQLP